MGLLPSATWPPCSTGPYKPHESAAPRAKRIQSCIRTSRMRDDHKKHKPNPQTAQKQPALLPSSLLCDFCAFLWLKLKLETGFRRTVFVPRVPRILTSVA